MNLKLQDRGRDSLWFSSLISSKIKRLVLSCIFLMTAACGVQPGGTPTIEPTELLNPTDTRKAIETSSEEPEELYIARQQLVSMAIEGRGIIDPDVLRAMRAVPRHEFVPDEYLAKAYADHPLPIGYGQTISQPYIVAWMTELLALKPGEKVLEIGTGSGYQAAVLAELGFVKVFSIEIVPELAERSAMELTRLKYDVRTKQGDGYYGWIEYAPFDAIIVTAAPDHLPAPLVEQLAPGGRIVIPIGPRGGFQSLWKFVEEDGELKAYNMGGVRFVPFTGEGIETGE